MLFRSTEEYRDFGDFTDDINRQAYQVQFMEVSKDYIDELVQKGYLHLFQIYNKDFSPKSTGTPNLHTIYWKMLFDERNNKDVVYKLNGEAEVFYRQASIPEDKIYMHKEGEFLINKSYKKQIVENGIEKEIVYTIEDEHYRLLHRFYNLKKECTEEEMKIIHQYDKLIEKNQVSHEIVKDRRYTVDKFLFHVPDRKSVE